MERLSCTKFGESLDPKVSRFHIYNLCEAGRIEGAVKVDGKWRIPPGARIKGRGVRTKHSGLEGLSVKQYAKKHGVTPARVYQLLTPEIRIPGAKRTPEGWDLPRRGKLPGRL